MLRMLRSTAWVAPLLIGLAGAGPEATAGRPGSTEAGWTPLVPALQETLRSGRPTVKGRSVRPRRPAAKALAR